jgi:mycofactocin precursor
MSTASDAVEVIDAVDLGEVARVQADEAPGVDELIEDEVLLEDVSIDGMCGVY